MSDDGTIELPKVENKTVADDSPSDVSNNARENGSSPELFRRKTDVGISMLHDEVLSPVKYGLYLDAEDGHVMVRIIKEESDEHLVVVKTNNNKMIVVEKKSVKIIGPEIVQLIKINTDDTETITTFDDQVEHQNLMHQLAPSNDMTIEPTCCQRLYRTLCCRPPRDDINSNKFRRNVRRSVNFLPLSARKKAIILDRYVSLVEAYAKVKKRYTIAFNLARFWVTLFNILTPAFVSIQPLFGLDATSNPMYWTTWATTLTSGLLTSYISLFKLDKKFYSTTRAYLRLETEGWQYFTLTNKYGKDETMPRPTHDNRFYLFCQSVESIRKIEMKVDYDRTTTQSVMTSSNDSQNDRRQ